MAFIYVITNDINGKQYVGKTETTIEERFKEHQKDCYKPRCEKRPLYAAMRKYGIEHFSIQELEETNNACEREIYWIEKLETFHNGYNATKGGDGKPYLDYDLIIETYKQVQNCNEVARIVGCHTDSVQNILKSAGITLVSSQEINKKRLSKAVNQYDLKTHEFITSYSSLIDAERALNKPRGHTHIAEVCKGKRKSAYGYYWQFVE